MHERANPIGYVEYHDAVVGDDCDSADKIGETIEALRAKGLAENKGYTQWGCRVEYLKDGAGVKRVIIYMGFAPKLQTTPPLDPRNNNGAPAPLIGSKPTEELSVPLGWKEQQFGRGT